MAYLWPIISPPEEYGSEAIYFRDVILEELGPGRHRLLELGVGGGHNLSHLTVDFDCTAVDLSPDMLALSERLNPGVPHREGDMRSIRLEEIFDAVLIHDASSYILFEEDLKDTFVKDYVYPMIRGHAIYEGVYLLGTSIARPLIAKRQIAIAKKFGAYAVSHGSTGKGNDQVRFEPVSYTHLTLPTILLV